MFEKEAEEYAVSNAYNSYKYDFSTSQEAFKDGAEFGYNKANKEIKLLKETHRQSIGILVEQIEELHKANEWHYMKDGDLPEVDNRIVLCVCGNGYIDGKRNYILKLLTRKEFPLFQPVYAWKEIILPKEIE